MFKKIMIANRGEVAIRIIRTCVELKIKTVAVYSEVDRNSLHVMLADEAYYIGLAPSAVSYLNIDIIIKIALKTKVDAIHPGYGFLSEKPEFAKACEKAGIHFIGPSVKIISDMGNKINARKLMRSFGIPVTLGVDQALENIEDAITVAHKIGYPIILKAAYGGGGKGIRQVYNKSQLPQAFKSCQTEARKYFKSSDIFIEKFILNPKHIEIQILADSYGNTVHLFERECSIQRRHQKLIEESPSMCLSSKIRKKMCLLSVKAAKKLGYTNAGTFEFIYNTKEEKFYFLEMNTRLQVEHPVTELITGVDIVKQQILITAGYPLKIKQKDINQKGHAIELRICAEDPKTFLPSPGRIRRCRIPQGPFVRVDAYCYRGYKVPIHYDPLIAKLICWGKDREDCIHTIQRALGEFSFAGIKTNVLLHKNILLHKKFLDGSYNNNFIEENIRNKNKKDFSHFIDERIFLISACIMAYKQHKKKQKNTYDSKWKQISRRESTRS